MIYFDPLQLLFILPALVLSLVASYLIKIWNNKYSQIRNINQISGANLIEKFATKYNLNIKMDITERHLGDHYDPTTKTIVLSRDVASISSIASVAIAAHEMGHALQHHNKSLLLTFRSILLPTLNIGTNLGYFLIILGLGIGSIYLSWVGILLFSGATLFTFFTLPIELDASKKALHFLKSENILYPDELVGAKKVLNAAALTYIAAVLQSLGQLLYFIFRVGGKKK